MTNPTEPGAASLSEQSLREQVARIIDTRAYEFRDKPEWWPHAPDRYARALTKADDILALTTPARSLDLPDGWVAVPRELTDEMYYAYLSAGSDSDETWAALLAAAPALTPNANEAAVAGDNVKWPSQREVAMTIDHQPFREGDIGGLRANQRAHLLSIARRIDELYRKHLNAALSNQHGDK